MQYVSNDLGLIVDEYNEGEGVLRVSVGLNDFTVYEDAPPPETPLSDGLNRGFSWHFIEGLNDLFDIAKIENGRQIVDRLGVNHTIQQDYVLRGITEPRAFVPWHLRNNTDYLLYHRIQLEYLALSNMYQLPVDDGALNTEDYWVEQFNHFTGGMGGESGGGGASHTWEPNTIYFYNHIPPQYSSPCPSWSSPVYWTPLLTNIGFKDSQGYWCAKYYIHASFVDLLKSYPEYDGNYDWELAFEHDILTGFCWHPVDNNPGWGALPSVDPEIRKYTPTAGWGGSPGQEGEYWYDSDYYVSRGINGSSTDSFYWIRSQMHNFPGVWLRIYAFLSLAGRLGEFLNPINITIPGNNYREFWVQACPVLEENSETVTERPILKGGMPPIPWDALIYPPASDGKREGFDGNFLKGSQLLGLRLFKERENENGKRFDIWG